MMVKEVMVLVTEAGLRVMEVMEAKFSEYSLGQALC